MVARYRYLEVSNPGLQMIGSNVSYLLGTRASFQYIRRIPALYFSQAYEALRQLDLVNPLLSLNEAWMDECAARLQPLVDQYKSRQNQIFIIEKFRDLIVTTRFCPEPAI